MAESRRSIANLITSKKFAKEVREALARGADESEIKLLLDNLAEQLKYTSLGYKQRPFIILPSQLDTTQPEDLGYGTEEWREAFYKKPMVLRSHPQKRSDRLSCYRNCNERVTNKKLTFIPEYSILEGRRCTFVNQFGLRCRSYSNADIPVCSKHIKLVAAVPRMNSRFMDAIKSVPLKEEFQRHLNDPNRRSMESELALMRTMMSSLLSRVDMQMDLKDLPYETISAIVKLCEIITGTVDRVVSVEHKLSMRLSVDQVTMILMRFTDEIVNILNPSQADMLKIADMVENLPLLKVANVISIEGAKTYGTEIKEGQKFSTNRDVYHEDGTITKDAYTPEQIKEIDLNKVINMAKAHPNNDEWCRRRAQAEKELEAFKRGQQQQQNTADNSGTEESSGESGAEVDGEG